jgi:hypothetical protein
LTAIAWLENVSKKKKKHSSEALSEKPTSPNFKTCLTAAQPPNLKIKKSSYDKAFRKTHVTQINNYIIKNKNKIRVRRRSYMKKWRLRPQNRILQNLRTRIRLALKGARKVMNTQTILGCSILEFRKHIESKFTTGMSWENYGKTGWHLDHITPCSFYDLSDHSQQKACFHYSNIQPLWAKDKQKNRIYPRLL